MRRSWQILIAIAVVATTLPSASSKAATHHAELRVRFDGTPHSKLGSGESDLQGSPDGHVTFIKEHGAMRLWMPALNRTVEMITTDIWDMHAVADPAPSVLGPSGHGFDANYAGGSKVLRLPSGVLAMIYHGENHPCTGDKAEVAIGLAYSFDDGTTWVRKGKIISAPVYEFPNCDERTFYGAGSFSAVVNPVGDYLYVYHHVWYPNVSWDVRVSRSRLDSGLLPGTWSEYRDGSWNEPSLGGLGDVMFKASASDLHMGLDMAGIPTVSWNTEYKMWLAVFTSMTGFWYTSSIDGIHWVEPRLLLRHAVLVSEESMVEHKPFIYYPSLVDPSAGQDGRTSASGILLYAHGDWIHAHHMIGRGVTITSVQVEDAQLANTGQPASWAIVYWGFLMLAAGYLFLRNNRKTAG